MRGDLNNRNAQTGTGSDDLIQGGKGKDRIYFEAFVGRIIVRPYCLLFL
jgi:hypothetical protein